MTFDPAAIAEGAIELLTWVPCPAGCTCRVCRFLNSPGVRAFRDSLKLSDERAATASPVAENDLFTAARLLSRWMVFASGVAFKSLYGEQVMADTDAFLGAAPPPIERAGVATEPFDMLSALKAVMASPPPTPGVAQTPETPTHAGPPWDTKRDASEFEPLCYLHGGVNLTPNAVARSCSSPLCNLVTFGVRMPSPIPGTAGPLKDFVPRPRAAPRDPQDAHDFEAEGALVETHRIGAVHAAGISGTAGEREPKVGDPRGPGIIGSHWIEPSAAALARPCNAVTSGAPPPVDELGAARERRDGSPISIESRADESGVVVDVDLGKPPGKR